MPLSWEDLMELTKSMAPRITKAEMMVQKKLMVQKTTKAEMTAEMTAAQMAHWKACAMVSLMDV